MNGSKIFRHAVTTLLIVTIFFAAAVVNAAVQTFDGRGQYIMSDVDTQDIAKQRACQRAERDACKKATVYLKSYLRSMKVELTDDEIAAVVNNIIKFSDVRCEKKLVEGDAARILFTVTLTATIDSGNIYDFINRD